MLGNGDQQKVEEIALVFVGFAAREEQMKIIGETEASHQVAAKVAPVDLDAIRIGLADMALGSTCFTDLHSSPTYPGNVTAGIIYGPR